MQQVQSFLSTQWGRFRAAERGVQVSIAIGALFGACTLCGIWVAANPGINGNVANIAPVATATSAASPARQTTATNVAATVTPNPKPTATATTTHVAPTATPQPQPTQVPPTDTPAPKYPPINGNPYDINFSCCNLIYSPPSDVCNWFNCIGNFWNGHGFMNECGDGTYSMSGGIRGDCSRHNGEGPAVYLP